MKGTKENLESLIVGLIESYFACYLYAAVIAREKNPVEAKTEKAQRNRTKRKIKNETEVETEKKRMTKTNKSRYCSNFILITPSTD